MSSKWVNKFAIMRDLSTAQGGIPVDVADTVDADQKPPLQNIIEDTEEEFYGNWVGGEGDFSTPDVSLIQHMLNVVRQYDETPDIEDEAEKVIEITKVSTLNPLVSEYKPKSHKGFGDTIQASSSKDAKKPKVKARKQRNMAIESLLQNLQTCSHGIEHEKMKLLKPADFTGTKTEASKENISQAIDKVTGWLDTQEQLNKKETKKKNPILNISLDPSTMFKKKNAHSTTVKKDLPESKSTVKPPLNGYEEYVPTSNAAEYYKKFLECSRMKEILQEDVWSRAERQMKEIDEQRKKEAKQLAMSALATSAQESSSSPTTSTDPDDQKLDVRMPFHHHELSSPCIGSVLNKEMAQDNKTIENCKEKCTENNIIENWREKNEHLSETLRQIKSWRTRDDNSKDAVCETEVTWRLSRNKNFSETITDSDGVFPSQKAKYDGICVEGGDDDVDKSIELCALQDDLESGTDITRNIVDCGTKMHITDENFQESFHF